MTSPGVRVAVAESPNRVLGKVFDWCDLWEMKLNASKTTIVIISRRASLIEICFRNFVLRVLEYCSAVWCSAADTHHKLQDRVVSGASFSL